MPNIEIHGGDNLFNARLSGKIRDLLRGVEGHQNTVVSTIGDSVTSLQGEPRAFLRVIFANRSPVSAYNDCMKRLAEINMDMEILIIREFIPKKA